MADFARAGFQQETIPAIAGAAGFGGTARSSGFQDILAKQARNLELGLAAQLGQQQFGAFNQSQQFQQQLPGQLAQLGGLQQSFPEAQRQFGLQQFMAAAPEADPRLGFIGPAFTSAFDTVNQQQGAGLGSQLLGPAATLGAAKIEFACIKEGTIIDCENEKKPVEDVRGGDKVFDKDGKISVVRWKCEFDQEPTDDRFIELTFDGDVNVVVCDMHKIDGVRSKDLNPGDKGLVSKKFVKMDARSYDLMTSGRDGSYCSNGIGIDSMIPELYEQARKVG